MEPSTCKAGDRNRPGCRHRVLANGGRNRGVPVSDVRVISTQDTDVTPLIPVHLPRARAMLPRPRCAVRTVIKGENHRSRRCHATSVSMNLTLIKGHIVLVERPEEPLCR